MSSCRWPACRRWTFRPSASPRTVRAPTPRPWRPRWRRRSSAGSAKFPASPSSRRAARSASTRISVQFDLNRDIDGAARDVQARDQCGDRGSARRPAVDTVVPQIQSGGDPDPHPRPDLEERPAQRHLRCRRHRGGAAPLAGQRRRRGQRQRRRAAGGAGRASIRSRSPPWDSPWRMCALPSPTPTRPAPLGIFDGSDRATTIGDQRSAARGLAIPAVGRAQRQRQRWCGSPPWPRSSRVCAIRFRPAGTTSSLPSCWSSPRTTTPM